MPGRFTDHLGNPNVRGALLFAALFVAGCVAIEPQGGTHATVSDATCLEWMEARDDRGGALPGTFYSPVPTLGCFDGTIGQDESAEGTEAFARWAATGTSGQKKFLVVRSNGGDAETSIGIVEDLQQHDTRILAHAVCASSCANYLFAGLRDRHVTHGTLLLFHGGFSDETRGRVGKALDDHYARMGENAGDPEADRKRLLDQYDENRSRQDELLRRAGADPAIIHLVDRADKRSLPADLCGGDTTLPRNFVYFDALDSARLGISALSGEVQSDPAMVNRSIASLSDREKIFVACRLPIDFSD